MKLGILNETVILIDTDFLNEQIAQNLTFYKELNPNRNFEKICLADLIYKLALNARVEEVGNKVDILFGYTIGNDLLTHCEPNNVFDFNDSNQVQIKTEKGTFIIRSYFGDENEPCSMHFINMLKIVNQNPRVSRIIMVADNPELNIELELMKEQNEKSLFLIKRYQDTDIEVPIKYVNIDFPISYALGLKKNEI